MRSSRSKYSPLLEHHRRAMSKRAVINLLLFALLLYIVIPAAGGLHSVIESIRQADAWLVLVAAMAIFGSYCFAALTYVCLALRSIRYFPTLAVQIAGGFVNRLLPAGLGGLGINMLYLIRQKHTAPEATAVVAANNLVGFIGNSLLLLLVLYTTPTEIPALTVPEFISRGMLAPVIVVVLLGIMLYLLRALAARLKGFITEALHNLERYTGRRKRFILAIGSSMMLTALHVAALYAVCQAYALEVSPAEALIAISIGVIAGAALPTPGGLGGAEAGLLAVLVAYGVSPAIGLAAVLTYRFTTFWLPLLPGYIMLQLIEKKYLYYNK